MTAHATSKVILIGVSSSLQDDFEARARAMRDAASSSHTNGLVAHAAMFYMPSGVPPYRLDLYDLSELNQPQDSAEYSSGSDAQFIAKTIEWSNDRCKSDTTILWILAHGVGGSVPGIQTILHSTTTEAGVTGKPLDRSHDQSPSRVDAAELSAAILSSNKAAVDILVLESCRVGQFDTAFILRQAAKFVAGSSMPVSGPNRAHSLWLNDLSARPDLDLLQLGRSVTASLAWQAVSIPSGGEAESQTGVLFDCAQFEAITENFQKTTAEIQRFFPALDICPRLPRNQSADISDIVARLVFLAEESGSETAIKLANGVRSSLLDIAPTCYAAKGAATTKNFPVAGVWIPSDHALASDFLKATNLLNII